MSEQAKNIKRVSEKINSVVMNFCVQQMRMNQYLFRANELTDFVSQNAVTTYDSSTRILRLLRQAGKIDYKVVKRSESLYKLWWVKDDQGKHLINPEYKPVKHGQKELHLEQA